MPLLVADQGQETWHSARLRRITASRAAACLGLDPDCGPLAAFNEIMGYTKKEDNPYLAHGRENEQRARDRYEEVSGNFVTPTGFWVHHRHDWLGASPDGLVGEDGGLELKCPVTRWPERMPEKHEIQCRVNMLCTGRRWWDYFCWHPDGREPYWERVDHCPATEAKLVGLLGLFYTLHVSTGTPPPRSRKKLFEGHDVTAAVVHGVRQT